MWDKTLSVSYTWSSESKVLIWQKRLLFSGPLFGFNSQSTNNGVTEEWANEKSDYKEWFTVLKKGNTFIFISY